MGKKSSTWNEIPSFPLVPNSTPVHFEPLSCVVVVRGIGGGRESGLILLRSSSLLDLSGYLCCPSPVPSASVCQSINKAKSSNSQCSTMLSGVMNGKIHGSEYSDLITSYMYEMRHPNQSVIEGPRGVLSTWVRLSGNPS